MSFAGALRAILKECEGALGVALMGPDGIPIEQAVRGPSAALDPAALGVELGRLLADLRKASDAVGGGVLRELDVRLARFWVLVQMVDDECYLVLALAPEANVGRARFLLRRHLLAIREQI
jgi:predicted regulator of Ras-like GTPase activity (Roadblock/LC7/MglB family)